MVATRTPVSGVTNTCGESSSREFGEHSPKTVAHKKLTPPLARPRICRHLAAELGEEYTQYRQEERAVDELVALGLRLVPFLLTHNAESDAVDLLLELESISKIVDYVDANTYQRVCLYMVSMVYYLTPPDDLDFLRTAHEIYKRHKCYTEALTLALRLQDTALIQEDFEAPTNPHMKRQLAYILARQQVNVPTDDEALTEILNNTKLSESFKRFGKELSVTEPKSLEDIYKSHLENTRGPAQVDSARQNLAGTFVNAFVNAGFGNDKLMVEAEEGQSWIYKNKDHGASDSAWNVNVFAAVPDPIKPSSRCERCTGMFSAAASLGLSLLWDTDVGLSHIDKYAYASEDHIKVRLPSFVVRCAKVSVGFLGPAHLIWSCPLAQAGAMLANGLIHSGVRTEMDAALALLSEHVEAPNAELRVAAIIG